MKATNIIWNVDDVDAVELEELALPTEIEIPPEVLSAADDDGYQEAISDYISDLTGFCHEGFRLEMTVHDLTRDQLILLKQQHLLVTQGHVSWGELADVDNLVSDEEIFEEYAGTVFSEDDFPCDEEEGA